MKKMYKLHRFVLYRNHYAYMESRHKTYKPACVHDRISNNPTQNTSMIHWLTFPPL